MKLNLTATNIPEERIKEYLEQNASPTLAEKINNGTQITKDGKQLINRKTLAGFFKYATEEARKQATKGAQFACIDDNDVFGWAIHYFEEEAIVGELFNLDGTPYQAPKTVTPDSEKKPKAPPKAPDKKPTPKPTQTAENKPQEPKAPTPKQTPTETPKTAQTAKKATVLPTPEPKPGKKKNVDTAQLSIFDLF